MKPNFPELKKLCPDVSDDLLHDHLKRLDDTLIRNPEFFNWATADELLKEIVACQTRVRNCFKTYLTCH